MFSKINIDNAIFRETASMPLTLTLTDLIPSAFFLTNSVYHLKEVILLILFFIKSNQFPFKKNNGHI